MRTVEARLALALAALVVELLLPATAVSAGGSVPPACHNVDLRASYQAADSATGHRYGRIVLRNVSGHRCRTGGYGGLSYVGGGDGTQIGAPADRTPSPLRSIVLRPRQRVISQVVEVVADVYSPRECRPAPVDGFRVYVPNATRAQYVRHPTTGCRNPDLHLISHRAYRRP
jgi:hypothetical protein